MGFDILSRFNIFMFFEENVSGVFTSESDILCYFVLYPSFDVNLRDFFTLFYHQSKIMHVIKSNSTPLLNKLVLKNPMSKYEH